MKRLITAVVASLVTLPVMAAMPVSTGVPALDEGGLVTMVTLVGLAAGWVARKRSGKK
jgi:hypothetical protein